MKWWKKIINEWILRARLVEDEVLDLPDPMKDENILVYFKRKKSGEFEEKDYYVWERDFINKMVTHEFVHENQSQLVMDLNFYQFAELIDIKPDRGSHFIHSMSEPYTEEDIEDEVMPNWLDHFGMKFHQLHASGHMNRNQLVGLINYVQPKKVFPIHTEHQELFKKHCKQVQRVKYASEYAI